MSTGFAQKYLRHPDLFPRRLSGEPCGVESLAIDFVGGPFVVSGLSAQQAEIVRNLWGSLCRELHPDEKPQIQVFTAAASDFLEGDLRGQPMNLDFNFQAQRLDLAGRHLLGVLQRPQGAFRRGALWTAAEDEQEFVGIFENFFRVVLAYRLLDLGGVLLHSAAVVDRELAFVFVGHSGAGKSTLSRLSLEGGRCVLSDDLNALLPAESGRRKADSGGSAGFMVERMPFAGDLRRPEMRRESFALGSVLLLGKDRRHVVEPVSAAKALAALLSCAPFVNADPWKLEQLEQILLSLCGTGGGRQETSEAPAVRVGRLRFHPRDDGFWTAVRAFVNQMPGESLG